MGEDTAAVSENSQPKEQQREGTRLDPSNAGQCRPRPLHALLSFPCPPAHLLLQQLLVAQRPRQPRLLGYVPLV